MSLVFDGWWDAFDTSTFTIVSDKVTNWANKGTEGSAWDMAQADTAKQPKLKSDGANGINVLNFEAADYLLTTGNAIELPNDVTIFTCFKPIQWIKTFAAGAHNNDSFFWGNSTTGADIFTIESGIKVDQNGEYGIAIDTNAANWTPDHISNSSQKYENRMHVACAHLNFASNTARLFVDGMFEAENTAYSTGISVSSPQDIMFGANDSEPDFAGFEVYYGEVIIIKRAVTIEERNSIEAYLAGKWGARLFPAEASGNYIATVRDSVTADPIENVVIDFSYTEGGPVVLSQTTDVSGNTAGATFRTGPIFWKTTLAGFEENKNSFVANQTGGSINIIITESLVSGEIRIVLGWAEAPLDLDAHTYGPVLPSGFEHVYFSNKQLGSADFELDRDDRDSFGPETTTIHRLNTGTYEFAIHDFSNKDSGTSNIMGAQSEAVVTVYRFGLPTLFFNVPNIAGTVWDVFDIDGDTGVLTPINTMRFESSAANVLPAP